MLKLLKQGTPSLNSNEHTLESWGANHVQSPQRAVGGTLCLTDQRLMFVPRVAEEKTGGHSWHVTRDDLIAIEVVKPQPTQVFGGGLRSRLRITTPHGSDLFVVNHLEAIQQRLNQVITDQHAQPLGR